MNWEYTEASNEEFESRRKNETYFRIFYVDENKKEHNVYKFWTKEDENYESVLNVLNAWKNDHKDGKEYFWDTSGYYMTEGKDKRYDTMEEMHKEWKSEPYDTEDRKYDKGNVDGFLERHNEDSNKIVLENLIKERDKISEKIFDFKRGFEEVKNAKVDFENDSEEKIKELTLKVYKLDDKFYEMKDIENVLRTRHFISESWNLDSHILEDLKYNLNILIENKCGYPSLFIEKAANKLNIVCGKYGEIENEDDGKRVYYLASAMWKDELKKQLDNICGYLYFSEYGIVDDKDEILMKYAAEHSNEIPYKEGTNKEIDYKALHSITQEKWNAIWDWMKMYGQNLWD